MTSSTRTHAAISRRAILALISGFGGFALAAGCSEDAAASRATAVAERTTLERIVVATGTIEPAREVEVRPRIAGIVERIHVDDGDRVEPGAVLIEIERELLASQVREAEAALREATIAQRFARQEVERERELAARGASSERTRDQADTRYERARAQSEAAAARLATLETQLSYATVRSPIAGRVLEVHTEEGNAISPVTSVNGGTLLLTLAGAESLHLEGLVDENEVARLALGQQARIRTEAFGERSFAGVLRRIAPLGKRIENVTYFEVEVDVVDPDASVLKPRMSGDAEIVAEVVEGAIAIPEMALRYRGDSLYVEGPHLAAVGGATGEREVEVGVVDGDRVEVLRGLAEGDEVFVE